MAKYTDYGRPMNLFFNDIPNFWSWADNWADKFWALGVVRHIPISQIYPIYDIARKEFGK